MITVLYSAAIVYLASLPILHSCCKENAFVVVLVSEMNMFVCFFSYLDILLDNNENLVFKGVRGFQHIAYQ